MTTQSAVRPHITTRIRQMLHSSDSQQILVAEFIEQLINDGEDEEFLVVCLEEIIGSAQALKEIIEKGTSS